ncbi:NepR family anti-sigma factor [Hyphomicrobium sp.]|uniref:NepR family anti-sigma factor n=1 Tax=Hyphomicrobium sp. TaxID=82 RepID=UPI0035671D6F
MQAPLPTELQGQIGQRLREAYIELINEPVPDRFVDLLQKLKRREEQGRGGES